MAIDWNIKFGDVLVMVSLVGSILYYAYKSGQFTQSIITMQREIKELKTLASTMTTAITALAVQDTKITVQAERLNVLDKRIEDLRKGRGYITEGREQVNREYR